MANATSQDFISQLSQAPAAQPAPTGASFSSPEFQNVLAKYFAIKNEGQTKIPLAGAAVNTAQAETKYNQDVADYNKQNAINALSAKARKDAKKDYTRQLNQTGGFDFFDPNGNKITAYDYAKATKSAIPTVLSGTLDPRQQSFADDFETAMAAPKIAADFAGLDKKLQSKQNVDNVLKKVSNGTAFKDLTPDEQAVYRYGALTTNAPGIQKKTPQEIINALLDEYKDIFQAPQYNGPISPTAQSPSIEAAPPSLFQRIIQSLHGGG